MNGSNKHLLVTSKSFSTFSTTPSASSGPASGVGHDFDSPSVCPLASCGLDAPKSRGRSLPRPPAHRYVAGNILGSLFEPLKIKLAPRVRAIRALAGNIDTEASLTWSLKQRERHDQQHNELLSLLKSYRQSDAHGNTMLPETLPSTALPAARNPAFYGRSHELNKLEDLLSPGMPPSELVVVSICGLAGSGKTQVALEFAYRHISDYDIVLWVTAESSIKLSASFSAFARDGGLAGVSASGQIPDAEQRKQAILRWLETAGGQGASPSN